MNGKARQINTVHTVHFSNSVAPFTLSLTRCSVSHRDRAARWVIVFAKSRRLELKAMKTVYIITDIIGLSSTTVM